MKLSEFDLNLLIALDALLTEKNVTRAGMRIHLSQSATSAALGPAAEFLSGSTPGSRRRPDGVDAAAQGLGSGAQSLASRRKLPSRRRTRLIRQPGVGVSRCCLRLPITVLMADALGCPSPGAALAFELVPTSERAVEALEAGTPRLPDRPRGIRIQGAPGECPCLRTRTR